MIPFIYMEPASLDEALALLAKHGEDAKLIAGGTGLVNLMKQRLVRPSVVIGLRGVTQLAGIAEADSLRIGALSTLATLETSPALRRKAPLFDDRFHLSAIAAIDAPLLGGAALFGIGWGLAGYCPGPAIASLGFGNAEMLYFLPALLAGIALRQWTRRFGSAARRSAQG